MWVITTAYDNVAQIYRLESTMDSVIIKGGQRGAERGREKWKKKCVKWEREREKWVVAERGSSVGCHYERWFLYWIIHHTSAVCLLLFCVVMRINADKPRGNSDYYFQHITMREESRRKEAGEEWKDKKSKTQREPHGAHNHLRGGVPENMRYRKVNRGRLTRI